MSARFVDLSVRPRGPEALARIAETASRLGLAGIAVEVSVVGGVELPSSVDGLRVFKRYTIRASSRREARKQLDRAPRDAIIVVEALSLDVLRYAGVNKLVDVVRPGTGLEAWAADLSQARLFRERGWGAIEYPLSRLVGADRRVWASFISMVRRAFSHDIPVVLVSDASDWLELWHPHTVRSLLVVAGVPEERATGMAVNSPLRVLLRRGYRL